MPNHGDARTSRRMPRPFTRYVGTGKERRNLLIEGWTVTKPDDRPPPWWPPQWRASVTPESPPPSPSPHCPRGHLRPPAGTQGWSGRHLSWIEVTTSFRSWQPRLIRFAALDTSTSSRVNTRQGFSPTQNRKDKLLCPYEIIPRWRVIQRTHSRIIEKHDVRRRLHDVFFPLVGSERGRDGVEPARRGFVFFLGGFFSFFFEGALLLCSALAGLIIFTHIFHAAVQGSAEGRWWRRRPRWAACSCNISQIIYYQSFILKKFFGTHKILADVP